MKQNITIDQVKELSPSGLQKYREWVYKLKLTKEEYEDIQKHDTGHDPLLSIGQMIQFLDEKQDYQFHIFRRTLDWKVIVNDMQYGKVLGEELCDSLWEAVKEVLESNT
jgi:hypothetical protein